jgi:hypothetical protein
MEWQMKISEEAEQRVKLLEEELNNYQNQMKGELDKYYHLKR